MSYVHELDPKQQLEADALFTAWYAHLRDNGIEPTVANSACMNIAFVIARAIGFPSGTAQNFPLHLAGMVSGWLLSLTPEQQQQFWDRIDEIEEEFAAADEFTN